MSPTSEARVQQALQEIVGLGLTGTSRAADMRGFSFGELHEYRGRMVGTFALHVQCAWRIDGPDGVLTGRSDLWEPAEGGAGVDPAHWDHERHGNLQDQRIAAWLGHPDPAAGSHLAPAHGPVVLAVRAMPFGGAEIDFAGEHRLTLFPAGSVGEDWRLFRPKDGDAPHFVVSGGRIEDGA